MSICTIYTAGVKVETFPCQVKTLAANRFRILCHAIKLLGIKKLLPRMVVSTIKQIVTVHTSDNQNHRRDTIWLSWLLNSLESIVVIEIYKRPNSHQYKWNPNPPHHLSPRSFQKEKQSPPTKKTKGINKAKEKSSLLTKQEFRTNTYKKRCYYCVQKDIELMLLLYIITRNYISLTTYEQNGGHCSSPRCLTIPIEVLPAYLLGTFPTYCSATTFCALASKCQQVWKVSAFPLY